MAKTNTQDDTRNDAAGSKKKKKKAAPLTPVERMEDMALTSRVTEALSPHLQGLTDKTLTEFIIHLTEVQIKTSQDLVIGQAQELKSQLQQQGAPELPLSLCKRLIEWVQEQSPRIKRWKQKKQLELKQAAAGASSSSTLSSKPNEVLKQVFPGLAKPNLSHSVELGSDFYEHNIEREREKDESSKRKVSNLPAWMTSSNDDAPPASKRSKSAAVLEPYQITKGRVEKTLDFGIVVSLVDFQREGVAYKSQLPTNYQKGDFTRGQSIWVKILSVTPQKIVVSVKDVNQSTGQDIMPHRNRAALDIHHNKEITSQDRGQSSTAIVHPGLDVARLKQQSDADHPSSAPARAATKQPLTEHELYEAQQLIRSGVLPVEQYPTYDPNLGMLAVEETEEETEVELAEVEPAFLRGQTKKSLHRGGNAAALEPIKIVKNPDGSLQRAAMQQANMAKERRELRQAQANQLIDSIPKDLNRPWEDPMPEAGERHFAQELRSINLMSTAMDGAPEWKQKAENKTLSYGIISNKSLKEQRESLPIYRLKKELIQAIATNQILVVIGETGSGKVSQSYLAIG